MARNFCFVCLIFSFFLMDIPDHGNTQYMLVKDHLRTLLQLLLPAFFLRFFLQFPNTKRRGGGALYQYRRLLIPAWALFLLIVGLEIMRRAQPGSDAESILENLAIIYALGYFISGLVIFGRRVLRRNRPIQQTKLRVVLIGLVGGLIPFFTAMVIGNFLPGTPLPYWQYLALSLLLVPVSFGLAIMRYGALDTGFVVRISLIYSLLTVLVFMGYFIIVGLVGSFLASVFSADTWPIAVLIAAGSGLVIMPLRNRVQIWIDHAFYPERRANRQAIVQLSEELSGLIEPDAVVKTIEEKLCKLYQPENFALFLPVKHPNKGYHARLNQQNTGQPDLLPSPNTPPISSVVFLAHKSSLAHLLNRLRRPLFREEIEDQILATDTDSDSLQILTQLDVALLVPLITGDRLLGFMAFGPKSSGEIYSQDDLANLRALAIQAASQVESRQLYQASLARKRLETELEVARDIQSNLLPDAALATGQFAISGRNEPCLQVGGDYFDYFMLDNGDLCFAIADVSGKGIPAALMMTSVRVAFRQEATPEVNPEELISNLNQVVNALGSRGHFICFFCGIWRPSTGVLRFCNAGMEPPVLFRSADQYRQSLRKGGPVLGVDKTARYRSGAIGLSPGDRIFLYTDGLTEEQNDAGEFFDCPRLLDLVQKHLIDTPDTLLSKVFSQVNDFGAPKRSDDRTAILLQINSL
ncbi:MAG: sigma-B regulation protein RsbU (phosphoserine phosphatase) [Candidatus Krumholzibacteriia bacterium]